MITKRSIRKLKKLILESGFFDEEYYLKEYREVRSGVYSSIDHYCKIGIKEGFKPNAIFDPIWYREFYQDVKNSNDFPIVHYISKGLTEDRFINQNEYDYYKLIQDSGLFDSAYYQNTYKDLQKSNIYINSLLHYVRFGIQENRKPNPNFDPIWYEDYYINVKKSTTPCIIHYITSEIDKEQFNNKNENGVENSNAKKNEINDDIDLSLIKKFDVEYYLSNYPDVKEAGVDPFEHYINTGWKEGREPNNWFDPSFYIEKYKDVRELNIEPLTHYLSIGKAQNRKTSKSYNQNSSDNFVKYKSHPSLESKLKLIAFYLPQFHPFPENDEWWGKGFTEWTNVTKAKPNFEGHYQPHLPIHTGFYDLRLPEVMISQAELAKNYGIKGFNFYYYWFDGKILMHKPFEILLENKDIDIEFCITWANENWTRRWDGQENDILIAQNHSIEDSIKFIESLYRYFEDSRYIRIDNKPVLIIYRVDIIPEMKKIVKAWREKVKKDGFDGIYLVCSQTFGIRSPEGYGFDAAMEFPPHTSVSNKINDKIKITNQDFEGMIYDYEQVVDNACKLEEPPYKLFRTAMLSWDNTARKKNHSHIFHDFSLNKYKQWLSSLTSNVLNNKKYDDDEKLVFVNAWNEWAEGTHLEPDINYGYGYLESSYEVLKKHSSSKKIIYVCHDAFFSGAQILTLNIIRVLHDLFKLDIHLVLLKGGELEASFKKYATVYNIKTNYSSEKAELKLINTLLDKGAKNAICNTTVSGAFLSKLSKKGIKTVCLIHELPELIRKNDLVVNAELIAKNANKIVFPSNYVKDKFNTIIKVSENKAIISPQGLYQINPYLDNLNAAKEDLRKQLGLKSDALIILGAGYADYRKGFDIFIDVASKVEESVKNTYFVWVGNIAPDMQSITDSIQSENVILISALPSIELYVSGADIYLMTSREDPFPSVVMEAMNSKVPVIGFQDAGGFKDIVTKNTGILTPFEDVELMSDAVCKLLQDNKKRNDLGENGAKLIQGNFKWNDYIYKLLELVEMPFKKVSVIVPNYNYEKYIKSRLKSIENQTYPIYELLYLDDCSTDNSLEIAKQFKKETKLDFKIIENKSNSSSVFKQWSKGIELAKNEFIWIAEADDLSNYNFLSEVIKGFDDPEVVLSYSQSKQLDENGDILNENYLDYTNDIDPSKWLKNYIRDGKNELADTLVVKNTIPNVSGVVFKKISIVPILKDLLKFKVGGDWFFYFHLLNKGKIAYHSKPLNSHRRHTNSVTTSVENNRKHFQEIVEMQDLIKSNIDVSNDKWEDVLKYREYVKNYLNIDDES